MDGGTHGWAARGEATYVQKWNVLFQILGHAQRQPCRRNGERVLVLVLVGRPAKLARLTQILRK
jgi:hypothetical protein